MISPLSTALKELMLPAASAFNSLNKLRTVDDGGDVDNNKLLLKAAFESSSGLPYAHFRSRIDCNSELTRLFAFNEPGVIAELA